MMHQLEEARRFVEAQGYTCAYLALYGSQNYGLALDEPGYRSDMDFKCAVLPGLHELARDEVIAPATLTWQGGQIEIKDVRRYTEVAGKLNPSYLETLKTSHYLAPCAQFEEIRLLAEQLPASAPGAFLSALMGQAMQKKKNLCHPFPAAMEKIRRYGYDGKQAHHMYRLLLIMRGFERSGTYELAPPADEIGFLLALKRNELPLELALARTEEWAQEIAAICARAHKRGKGNSRIAAQMREIAAQAIEEHVQRTNLAKMTGKYA